MPDTPNLSPAAVSGLERLVTAARGAEPRPLPPEQLAALVEAVEGAVLTDRVLSEYATVLTRLWGGDTPPTAAPLEEELVVRVRAEGLRVVPIEQLVQLAVAGATLLNLRAAVYGSELPPYWFRRLRALEPRVDQVRDDILQRLATLPAPTPGDVTADEFRPDGPGEHEGRQ